MLVEGVMTTISEDTTPVGKALAFTAFTVEQCDKWKADKSGEDIPEHLTDKNAFFVHILRTKAYALNGCVERPSELCDIEKVKENALAIGQKESEHEINDQAQLLERQRLLAKELLDNMKEIVKVLKKAAPKEKKSIPAPALQTANNAPAASLELKKKLVGTGDHVGKFLGLL